VIEGKPVCKPCTDDTYFSNAHETIWDDMDWVPNNGASVSDNNFIQKNDSK
jgi:hypothetical protein